MLEEKEICKFWEKRATKYGLRTVGNTGESYKRYLKVCKKRRKLVFSHCSRSLRTLDFGCGLGSYAKCFESYLGVDINRYVLSYARKFQPKKKFILLKQPFLSDKSNKAIFLFQPELFFTVTVLQHNSDALVKKILKGVAQISQNIMFSLYENSEAPSFNLRARTPEDYVNLLSRSFKILTFKSFSHYTYGEKHNLILVKAKSLLELR